MIDNVITTTEVAKSWGYMSAHEQIRNFLNEHLAPVMEIKMRGGLVRLYDKDSALALGAKYKDYVTAAKERIRAEAAKMGRERQKALAQDGLSGKGIPGNIGNKIKTMSDRIDRLEEIILRHFYAKQSTPPV